MGREREQETKEKAEIEFTAHFVYHCHPYIFRISMKTFLVLVHCKKGIVNLTLFILLLLSQL